MWLVIQNLKYCIVLLICDYESLILCLFASKCLNNWSSFGNRKHAFSRLLSVNYYDLMKSNKFHLSDTSICHALEIHFCLK